MKNLICVAFVMLLPLTLASETQHRFRISVVVKVVPDEATQSIFLSYVKRELRSLGDVDIVNENEEWHYELNCLVIEQTFANNSRKTGDISIAYIICTPFRAEHLPLGKVVWYPNLKLRVTRREHLEQTCKEIVVEFDTKHLEILRETTRLLRR